MTSKDSTQDQELLDRYRRASDTDAAGPSEAARSAILAESRRVAEQLATQESPPPIDVSRPAANDSRWKITAFGTVGAALLAALLIAPHYWQSLPTAQESTAPATASTAAPAGALESKSANSDAASQPTATALARAAVRPKLESLAPSRRSESSQEVAALQENAVPLDKTNSKPAQNYAPAPLALRPAPATPPAFGARTDHAPANDLVPAPAPTAPIAGYTQNVVAGLPMNTDRAAHAAGGTTLSRSSDRAASAARERNAPEPENLQSAAAAGDLAQVTLLLDRGAAVDARDALGRTPLLLAVAPNRIAVVRLLLARGADPNAADRAGLTPLQQARTKDLRDVAALLEQAGAR